ncbi:gustatory receptor for sugar taste 64e-like [Chrysoperla carnea]|uniref:gustatory receptor for sugar taste 64e-like n=1 Tax=Chrysoperla carnea TaxID=189513 RepID=UPI001D094E6E|nr:gustatory receptor for sugar taste 64e-like [Chrysoperla carnea]
MCWCLYITLKWPEIMKEWTTVDDLLQRYRPRPKMQSKIRRTTYILVTIAIIEHAYYQLIVHINCGGSRCGFYEQVESQYFIYFRYFTHTRVRGLYLMLTNVLCTFAWTFADIFLIIISTALAEQFKLITDRVKLSTPSAESKIVYESFWGDVQEDYTKVTILCKKLDEILSKIIFIAIANDIYSICSQLFAIFEWQYSMYHQYYALFSVSFLIGRTILVILSLAEVNEESRRPLLYMLHLPECVLLQRFIQQICVDPVGLTAFKLFYVKRDKLIVLNAFIEQLRYGTTSYTCFNIFTIKRSNLLATFTVLLTYYLVLLQQTLYN